MEQVGAMSKAPDCGLESETEAGAVERVYVEEEVEEEVELVIREESDLDADEQKWSEDTTKYIITQPSDSPINTGITDFENGDKCVTENSAEDSVRRDVKQDMDTIDIDGDVLDISGELNPDYPEHSPRSQIVKHLKQQFYSDIRGERKQRGYQQLKRSMTERVVRRPPRDHSADSGLSSPGSNLSHDECQLSENFQGRGLTRHMSMDRMTINKHKLYRSICDLQQEAQAMQNAVADLFSTGTMRRRRTASAGLSIAARKQKAKASISSYTPVAPSGSVWGQKFDEIIARLKGCEPSADDAHLCAEENCGSRCAMSDLRDESSSRSDVKDGESLSQLETIDQVGGARTECENGASRSDIENGTTLLHLDTADQAEAVLKESEDSSSRSDIHQDTTLSQPETAEHPKTVLVESEVSDLRPAVEDERPTQNIILQKSLSNSGDLFSSSTKSLNNNNETVNHNSIEDHKSENFELSDSLRDIITFSEDSYPVEVEEDLVSEQHNQLVEQQPPAKSCEFLQKSEKVREEEMNRLCRSMTLTGTDGQGDNHKSSQMNNLLRSISFHRPDLATYNMPLHSLRRTDSNNDVWIERPISRQIDDSSNLSLTSKTKRSSTRSSWRKLSRIFSFSKKTRPSASSP